MADIVIQPFSSLFKTPRVQLSREAFENSDEKVVYSKSRKPRIYPWMNAFFARRAYQLNSFCCEAVLEDTTALAVELHR